VGVFFIDRSLLDRVKPTWVGSDSVINAEDYLDYDLTFSPSAKRFEAGTLSTVGVAGAYAALELILELGLDFIQQRVLGLTDLVRQGATQKGWKVYSPWKPEERSGIISIYKHGVDCNQVRVHLLKHKVLTTVRADRLRIAPHCYLSEEEIQKVVDLLP